MRFQVHLFFHQNPIWQSFCQWLHQRMQAMQHKVHYSLKEEFHKWNSHIWIKLKQNDCRKKRLLRPEGFSMSPLIYVYTVWICLFVYIRHFTINVWNITVFQNHVNFENPTKTKIDYPYILANLFSSDLNKHLLYRSKQCDITQIFSIRSHVYAWFTFWAWYNQYVVQ